MRRHQPDQAISPDARDAAIALGNFDGVHLGHQAVIASARARAKARGLAFGIAVFEPHPRRFFEPDAPPFRLQSSAQRARTLEMLGVNELFDISFDAALTQLSDRAFAETILTQRLGAAHIGVGYDFRFGRGRMGDVISLARIGEALGFSVEAVAPVEIEGAKISSTIIREAIAAGNVERAAALLSRPWAVEGVVQHGFARGRTFGFPTANLELGDYVRPRLGIYAVRVRIGGARLAGVASVGVNPTIGALVEPVLEAHIFNFDAELYGKRIEVEFAAFLRDEAKFDSVDELKRRMNEDAAKARAALA